MPHILMRRSVRVSAPDLLGVMALMLAIWIEVTLVRAAAVEFGFVALSLAVVASAALGGLRLAALTALGAVLAADYVLLAPGTLLTAGSATQAGRFGAVVLGWLAVCWGIDALRRRHRSALAGRREAARTAAQAGRVLQLTGALAVSRTPEAVIEAAVQESMHALRADAGQFLLVSDDGASCHVARSVAHEADVAQQREGLLKCPSPEHAALERRAPVPIGCRDAWRSEFPDAAEDAGPPLEATVAVPLVIRGRVAAIVALDFRTPRLFTPDDEEFLSTLGTRAAVSLDRTWQYELAQRARLEAENERQRADQELAERQRTELALRASETRYRALATRTMRLHELTAALSEAVTLGAVARAVVEHGAVVVGARAAEVAQLVPPPPDAPAGGNPYLQALFAQPSGADAAAQPVTDGSASSDVLRTREPVFVPSWAEGHHRYWHTASEAADGAYVSSAILPLLVEGAPIGVLTFHFSVPVNFDAEYQALLVSVAQHCAQALDRARLYESAQRARSEAEAANRLKDEFLSIVSHELRTPLNAVLGWAAMLQTSDVDAALAARAVRAIRDNASRQAQLIDDLLDATRVVAGQTTLDAQDVRIGPLIMSTIDSLMPLAVSRQIDLQVSGAVPAVIVRGDLRRLEQVLFNLLGNALKFTPSGGRIVVASRVIAGQTEIRVTDSGIGIDPDFLPHVFERFRQQDSTASRRYGGLGLGLSIARQLVDAHGGTITAESGGRNQGSTFCVRLPLARPAPHELRAAEAPRADASARPAPRLDGIRILVVDDDPDARELAGHALHACGAQVTIADSAAAALNVLRQKEVDALLADIAMPDEDGCSLMRRIRASSDPQIAALPAAAISAHARAADRQQSEAAGFQIHLAKPVQAIVLARTVERLVQARAITSSLPASGRAAAAPWVKPWQVPP